MDRIEIDDAPGAVRELMARGQFHSHPDGKWRFSPFHGETVHINDPTARFADRAEFPQGLAAAADPASGLYACVYRDGSRAVWDWDRNRMALMWQLYAPLDAAEAAQRAWLAEVFA